MFANCFHLETTWHFDATLPEVGALVDDLVVDPAVVSGMCPAVFPGASLDAPGRPDGTGRVIRLHTRGWLPYSLDWKIAYCEIDRWKRYVQEASGDFEGRAVWRFTEVEDGVRVELDWRLKVNKPLLRRLTFLLKPLFACNHHWAMARARANVQREIERRRALNLGFA